MARALTMVIFFAGWMLLWSVGGWQLALGVMLVLLGYAFAERSRERRPSTHVVETIEIRPGSRSGDELLDEISRAARRRGRGGGPDSFTVFDA